METKRLTVFDEFTIPTEYGKVLAFINVTPGSYEHPMLDTMPVYKWDSTGYTLYGVAGCNRCLSNKLIHSSWPSEEAALAEGGPPMKDLLRVWAAVHDCKELEGE